MPKLKFAADVGQFGLFKSVAATRGRLIAAVVVATAASLGAGFWSADYIMERSASVGLNILIITTNMVVVMITAYLQALLVGDLFFEGPWREQVVMGDRSYRKDLDAEVVVADHQAEFMILLLALVVGNAMLVNYGAGGFIDDYHTSGFFRAKMRSSDVEEQLTALRDMTDPTQFELWENQKVREIVVDSLDDPNAEVREQAAWNAGAMKIESAREELMRMVRDTGGDPSARAEAAIALGRLAPSSEAREAIESALGDARTPELQLGLIRALGVMADPASFGALKPYLGAPEKEEDEALMIYAIWAAQETRSPAVRDYLLAELEPEQGEAPEGRRLCALLDAMKMVATSEDIIWARKRFISTPKEVSCVRVVWEERDERRQTILFSDSLRTKYMKVVANSGEAAKYRAWFQRIVNDTSEPWGVREQGSLIIKQLNQAGL